MSRSVLAQHATTAQLLDLEEHGSREEDLRAMELLIELGKESAPQVGVPVEGAAIPVARPPAANRAKRDRIPRVYPSERTFMVNGEPVCAVGVLRCG